MSWRSPSLPPPPTMKSWRNEIRWRLAAWIRRTAKRLDRWVSP